MTVTEMRRSQNLLLITLMALGVGVVLGGYSVWRYVETRDEGYLWLQALALAVMIYGIAVQAAHIYRKARD